MDSSAFHVLLIPICQGIGFGLIAGTMIHRAIGWLTARGDRLTSAGEDSFALENWRQDESSPKIGDSRVNWKNAF